MEISEVSLEKKETIDEEADKMSSIVSQQTEYPSSLNSSQCSAYDSITDETQQLYEQEAPRKKRKKTTILLNKIGFSRANKLRSKKSEKEELIRKLQLSNSELEGIIKLKNSLIYDLEENINEKSLNVEKLTSKVSELENQAMEIQQERDTAIEDIKKKEKELNLVKTQSNDEAEKFQKKIEELEDYKVTLSTKITELDITCEHLEKRIEVMEDEATEATEKVEQLNKITKEKSSTAEALELKIEELENFATTQSTKITELKNANATLQIMINNRETEVTKAMRKKEEELEQQKEILLAKNNRIDDLEDKIKLIQKDKRETNTEIIIEKKSLLIQRAKEDCIHDSITNMTDIEVLRHAEENFEKYHKIIDELLQIKLQIKFILSASNAEEHCQEIDKIKQKVDLTRQEIKAEQDKRGIHEPKLNFNWQDVAKPPSFSGNVNLEELHFYEFKEMFLHFTNKFRITEGNVLLFYSNSLQGEAKKQINTDFHNTIPTLAQMWESLERRFGDHSEIIETILNQVKAVGQIEATPEKWKQTWNKSIKMIRYIKKIQSIEKLDKNIINYNNIKKTLENIIPDVYFFNYNLNKFPDPENTLENLASMFKQIQDLAYRRLNDDEKALQDNESDQKEPISFLSKTAKAKIKFAEVYLPKPGLHCGICEFMPNTMNEVEPEPHIMGHGKFNSYIVQEVCPKVVKLTTKQRYQMILDTRLCKACCRSDSHSSETCNYLKNYKYSKCKMCNNRYFLCHHHTAENYQKFKDLENSLAGFNITISR